MQLVEVVETLGGENCMGETMTTFIKIATKAISRLRNVNYPLTQSPGDRLAKTIWVGFVRKNCQGYGGGMSVSQSLSSKQFNSMGREFFCSVAH